MKLSSILFLLLLAMGLAVGIALVTEESPEGHGFAHPDFPTMQQGGDGEARHRHVVWLGWGLGTLQILFLVGLLAFGAPARRRWRLEEWVLIGGGVFFALMFLGLVVAYRSYAAAGGGSIVLGFPVPTAWMLYGVGFAPAIFILLYLLRFDSWILDQDELARHLEEIHGGGGE